jgi:NAD(P)-dependent dehydrogenase (short-subunit alcohol dehydrogenase family)
MPSVFISGSATGIGAGLVGKLAHEGWQVFAGYHRSPPDAASWSGNSLVTAIKCDVTSIADVEAAARKVASTTGNKLDLLINNAGYFGGGGVVESANIDEYRRIFEINFFSVLNVLKAFMPLIRNGSGPDGGKGRVITVASSSTYMTFPMASAYTVSKQAVKTATMHLRMETAPFGVQATVLDPGAIETPMSEKSGENAAKQWSAIPEHLRPQYRERFIDTEQMMQKSFKLQDPDHFANEVYRKIIASRRFKPIYVIGPGVAVMPWLHRLLPVQQVENAWDRLFRAKQ